jgi:hypothetical protein
MCTSQPQRKSTANGLWSATQFPPSPHHNRNVTRKEPRCLTDTDPTPPSYHSAPAASKLTTHLPNAIFVILHTSLTLMFIYCRYKSLVSNRINITHITPKERISFCLTAICVVLMTSVNSNSNLSTPVCGWTSCRKICNSKRGTFHLDLSTHTHTHTQRIMGWKFGS